MKHRKWNLKNKITISLLGRSGCGKGTQAEFIMRRLGKSGYNMSMGRALRSLLRLHNPTTDQTVAILRAGKLYPSWFVQFVWLKQLIEGGHAAEHLLFDGAPRMLQEAQLLDEVIKWHGRPLPVCLYLEVSRYEATRRLRARGRTDDTPRAIRNRMNFFDRKVMNVIRYFQNKKRLIRINGEQKPERIAVDIDRALAHRFGVLWPRAPR